MSLTILTFSLFHPCVVGACLWVSIPLHYFGVIAYTWLSSCILEGWTNVSCNIVVIGHLFGVVLVEIRVSGIRFRQSTR